MSRVRVRAGQRHRTPAPRRQLDRAIGARIRQFRQARGLTGAKLGAPYYTKGHISRIELGKIGASLHAMAHFAKRMGVPLRELIPPEL